MQEVIKQIEGVAERAARLARYLEMRVVIGLDHVSSVKAQNKAGRLVHEKVFGYNATHDINI